MSFFWFCTGKYEVDPQHFVFCLGGVSRRSSFREYENFINFLPLRDC
eukprot:g3795.t1